MEENQKLLEAKEENKKVLDDVLGQNRKLLEANIKLRKSIDNGLELLRSPNHGDMR